MTRPLYQCRARTHESGDEWCSCYCVDCGKFHLDFQMYALHNELWVKACEVVPRVGLRRVLCVPCVERRLERAVTHDDLSDAPVNSEVVLTSEVRARRTSGS